MPIIFSNQTIVQTTIGPCASIASLISALHTVFTAAGWPSTTYMTTGHEYTLTSPAPQGLQVKMRLYDPSDGGGWAMIQFLGASGLPLGVLHKLNSSAQAFVPPTLTYNVWANICSTFIGVTDDARPVNIGAGGYAVAGGVPFALGQTWTGDCSETPPPDTVTELWFSCGDTEPNLFQGNGISFRNSFLCSSFFDTCYNGNLRSYSTGGHPTSADLQLVPIRTSRNSSGFSDGLYFYHPPGMVYQNQALEIEPYLAWGLFDGEVPPLRAELYDSVLLSQPNNPDALVVTLEISETTGLPYLASWANYLKAVNKNGVVQNGDSVSYYTSLLLLSGNVVPQSLGRSKTYAH